MSARIPAALPLLAIAAALAMPASAQVPIRGSITADDCGRPVDALTEGGELYSLKVRNPSNGPDSYSDWLFDLTAKGGTAIAGVTAGGSEVTVAPVWRDVQAPSDAMFAITTFPGGWVALDSGLVADGGVFTAVERQRVGNSLPIGVASGIGLTLPGNASPYMVDTGTGTPSAFPFGTNSGIEVVFAPLAEVNAATRPGGCGIGGEANDPQTGFGLVTGYNVYRIEGTEAVIPQPEDFMGAWQYYIPYGDFDHDVVNPGPGLPHPGAGDPNPDADLAGLQNFDGIPYTGDEIVIYQDSARNPDGSSRISGTGPDLTGNTGYWYAFQPVVTSSVALTGHDGLGYSVDNLFRGDHTIDADADVFQESLDLDLDGSPEFYSPQAQIGQNGLGLTNGGVPLLSPPVFGRANPLIAGANIRLAGRRAAEGVVLTLSVGFEDSSMVGYEVLKQAPGGDIVPVNDGLIFAQGGEASTYRIIDTARVGSARLGMRTGRYWVNVHFAEWGTRTVGPFDLSLGADTVVARRSTR